MARLKISGFHSSPNSFADGIGTWLLAVDAAGVPFTIKCVDGTTGLSDALRIMQGSSVKHNLIFRHTTYPENQGGYDTPDYNMEPAAAAAKQWASHTRRMPQELDPALVWSEIINEPRKEVSASDWIGEFCYAAALLALEQGYKFCAPGYSTGTPDEGAWETDGMLKFLGLIAQHPQQLGIALHEYSLSNLDIMNGGGMLVGRYRLLLQACEKHGIPHPPILFTEWGWNERTLPAPAVAMQQIEQAGALYAKDPAVLGAAIWALDRGWGTLHQKAHALMQPLAELLITRTYPDPVEPDPDPEAPALHKAVVGKFGQEHTKQDRLKGTEWLEDNYGRTGTRSDDDLYNLLRPDRANADSYAIIFDPELPSQREAIKMLDFHGITWHAQYLDGGPVEDPLNGLRLGHVLSAPHVLTSNFNAPRSYANGKHEGIDFDVTTLTPDSPASVLSAYPGQVVKIAYSATGYGNYVVMQHEYKGYTFFTRYAHMDSVWVHLHTIVGAGFPLGEIGDTGLGAEHVHLGLEAPGHGLSGYVVPDVRNPLPYYPLPAANSVYYPPAAVDMADYFLPEEGAGDLLRLENNWGEGSEMTQLQRGGNGVSYLVKNGQYERRLVMVSLVFLKLDTSRGDGRYYTIDSLQGWVPRYWNPGDIHKRTEKVKIYRKADCSFVDGNTWETRVKFKALHPTINTADIARAAGVDNPMGLSIENVVEIHWLLPDDTLEEHYYYAPGLGLVAWTNRAGKCSWATNLYARYTVPDLVRERGCWE